MRQLSTLMNFGTPSPSKPPKKKKQKTKSQVKMAAAQGQGQGQGQAQCQGTTPISNPSCSPMQHIIQVGNETYHQMQPMQHIQPMQAMQCSTSFQNHPNSTYSNTPNTSHIPPPWAQDISLQIQSVHKKLEKLDSIETSLSRMQGELNSLSTRVLEVEKSQQFISNSYDESTKTNAIALNELDNLKTSLEDSIRANNQLSEEILDLQCRSMRDNLLFYGVAEAQRGEMEDCEKIVLDICRSSLNITDDVLIERAHRIGRPNDNRPRPIVAKFSRFPQREVVRKSAFKLKGANISIGEQFPKIIQERRKKLLPVMKEASDRQRKAVLIKDKLFIDGKPYHPPATEADHLDAPVPAQGAEGHSSPGGRWERRDTRGGGRGRRTR